MKPETKQDLSIFIMVLAIIGALSLSGCESEYSQYYYYNTANNNASYYIQISENKATLELNDRYINLQSDYIICSEKHIKTNDSKYLDTLKVIAGNLICLGNRIIGLSERQTNITKVGYKVVNDKGEQITGANSVIINK
jgi:hypothetical protein